MRRRIWGTRLTKRLVGLVKYYECSNIVDTYCHASSAANAKESEFLNGLSLFGTPHMIGGHYFTSALQALNELAVVEGALKYNSWLQINPWSSTGKNGTPSQGISSFSNALKEERRGQESRGSQEIAIGSWKPGVQSITVL